jgi:hypothetical protein
MARLPGICGIEFGKDAISVVHYIPEENTVTTFGIEPLDDCPWPWWQSVETEFKPLVRTVRANGHSLMGTRVVCSLPAEHAVVARLLIDTAEPSPDSALHWELGRHVVGSLDEYLYDFQKLETTRPSAVACYLAAAYRATWVGRTQEFLKKRRFVPRAIDLDVFALVNAFEANYREHMSSPAFLVLGGQEFTKVILTWNGNLVDYEQFRFDPDILGPEAYAERLRKVLRRLKGSYPSLAGRTVVPVFVSGVMFTWDKYAAECFRTMSSMQVLNPFRNIVCNSVPESSLRLNGPRLAVAVGLAIRGATVSDT